MCKTAGNESKIDDRSDHIPHIGIRFHLSPVFDFCYGKLSHTKSEEVQGLQPRNKATLHSNLC